VRGLDVEIDDPRIQPARAQRSLQRRQREIRLRRIGEGGMDEKVTHAPAKCPTRFSTISPFEYRLLCSEYRLQAVFSGSSSNNEKKAPDRLKAVLRTR
jgi:hypothetical protein